MKRLIPLILCLILSYAYLATAQDFWQPSKGPWGGQVQALAEAPDGTLFAGTLHGMYRSTDNGVTWQAVNPVVRDSSVTALLALPSGVVIVGVSRGTVYRSSDNGDSWFPTALASQAIGSLITAPNGDLYAGVANTSTPAVFRSTDEGITWTGTDTTVKWARSMTATAGGIFAINQTNFYRSTDNGASWMKLNDSLRGFFQTIVHDSGGNLLMLRPFAIAGGINITGLIRSTDNGTTWTKIDSSLGVIPALGIGIASAGTIYLSFKDSIYRSSDTGKSWAKRSVQGFIGDPLSPLLIDKTGHIFAGSQEGVLRSIDSGGNWSFASDGMTSVETKSLTITPAGALFADQRFNMFRSTESGENWISLNRSGVNAPAGEGVMMTLADGTGDGSVFVRVYGYLAQSTDNGESWIFESLTERDGVGRYYPLAIGPAGEVYTAQRNYTAGIPSMLIYRSFDSGKSWESAKSPNRNETVYPDRIYSIAVDSAGEVFVADGGWIFSSTDRGDSWKQVTPVDSMPGTITALTFAPNGDLYAVGNGVYRKHKVGNIWVTTGVGLKDKYPINALIISNKGDIYAGTDKAGAFRSTDQGSTWTNISGGLPVSSVTSFAIHPDGHLYAGTTGGSVVRSAEKVAATSYVPMPVTSDDLMLDPIISVSGITTIRFVLPHAAHARVDIISMTGRPVASPVDDDLDAGVHSFRWEIGDAQSGMYLCWLRVDGTTIVKKIGVLK